MTPGSSVSDVALIYRIVGGDDAASDLFVHRYTRLVWWILVNRLRLPADLAEEVYQEVFVHLYEDNYKRLRNWDGEGDFASYLRVLVHNLAIDRLRRRRPEGPLPDPDADQADFEQVGPGPQELAWVEQQRDLLARAVERLSDPDRELFTLRYVEERRYEEIARACGITVNNVGVRLSRLTERLQRQVAEAAAHGPVPPDSGVRFPDPGTSTG